MSSRARRLLRNGWPSATVFAVALAGYCATLCPTVFVEGSGENIVCVWTLGVAHPPGFPLYCLLGRAFAGLIAFGEPAFRVNLFSAVMGAAAATGLFVFSVATGLRRIPAAAAALTFAFSATFWRQATIAEVYTLSTLLLVVQLGLLLAWRARLISSTPKRDTTHPERTVASANRDAALLWFSLTLGLALSVHYQHALLLPAYLLFITLIDRTVWRRGRTLLAASALALLGFALHIYAPMRSAADPPIDWGNPETFANWWRYLTAEQYRGHMFHQPLSDMAANFTALLRALPAQLTWPGLPLALGGLLALWRRDRALCWATAAIALVTVVWAIGYDIPWEIDVYYLPAVLAVTIWLGHGLQALVNWARAHHAARPAAAVCLLLPALALGLNFRANDLSDQTFVLDNARDILAVVEPDSATILPSTNPTFALLYLKHVQREASELQFFSRLDRGIAPSEKAVSPASELQVTPEPRFVADALAASTPVYTVERQPLSALPGFAQVPWGCIYRIVPADLEAHWRARAPDPLARNFHFDLDRQRFIYGTEQALLACRYLLVQGDAASESGESRLADDLYERALSLGADLPSVFAQVGQRYAEQGRSERALALYQRALERHDDALLHNRLGAIYGRENRLEEAERQFTRAIELKPDYADAHANLASVYGRRGDVPAAIAELEAALSVDPNNLLALKNLAHAYAQTGRKEDARGLLRRALEVNPAQEDVRSYLRVLEGD